MMDNDRVVVLFEVTVKKGKMDEYMDLVALVREKFSDVEGLIYAERFSSLSTEGKLLSMSIWESEEAVERWRNNMEHKEYQKLGRDNIFEEYKITVASPIRTYSDRERDEAPEDSNEYFGL